MAYDAYLEERINRLLREIKVNYSEKKMFGGLCYMVDEKMCLGIVGHELMIRIEPEKQDYYLKKKGCRPMDFTHKPMKGFLYIDAIGTDKEKDLKYWIQQALDFNPKAKSTKKKK